MSPRPAVAIGGRKVLAGRRARFEIPVAGLPAGGAVSMPVAVVHGRREGPTVWLSAAIHGDEVLGVEVISRVLRQVDARSLGGTIIAVPIVNVFGFTAGSRYLPDRRDLNRSFPGSRRGSLAARLATLVMTEIVALADYGIDLHTGSDHRDNWPQVRADLTDEQTRELAIAFGAPAMLHSRARDGSLREAAVRLGKPTLVIEAGQPLRFDEPAVTIATDGVLRVLQHLDMIRNGAPPVAGAPVELSRSRWLRARRGGVLRLTVDLGNRVSIGDTVGEISDAFGYRPARVRSRVDGYVIGVNRRPVVYQGDAVVHIGEPA